MAQYVTIEQAQHGDRDVVVVRLEKQDILDPQTIEHCKEQLEDVDASQRVVLNLERVQNVSTAFITILIVLSRAAGAHEGRLVICNVQPRVADVFRLLRVERIAAVAGSLAEAMARVCEA